VPNVKVDERELGEADALKSEIESFIAAIREGHQPQVSGRDGPDGAGNGAQDQYGAGAAITMMRDEKNFRPSSLIPHLSSAFKKRNQL